MKQKKPLEILSLVSAFGAVLSTPWLIHGSVISRGRAHDKTMSEKKSTQDDDYEIDAGIVSSTECEPPSGEVADGVE